MQVFLYLLYGVEFVIAVLLILVILIQRSKSGGGLGGLATTSSGVEEAFGSDAGNVLVRVTWMLGAFFLVTTITIGLLQGFIARQENFDMGGEDYMSSSETGIASDATLPDGKAEDKATEKTEEEAEDKATEKTEEEAEEKATDKSEE